MRDDPAGGVARDVELGHDPDAALGRVGDDHAHLRLREKVAVRAQLLEFGMGQALDPEALVVGQVQVQDVQLHDRHGVEIALDHLHRLPVPGDVDHEAAPGEARPVGDHDRGQIPARAVPARELQQGLEAVEDAERRRGAQGRLAPVHLEPCTTRPRIPRGPGGPGAPG